MKTKEELLILVNRLEAELAELKSQPVKPLNRSSTIYLEGISMGLWIAQK